MNPALPGHWRCPLQGGGRSDTQCAKPGGVSYFQAGLSISMNSWVSPSCAATCAATAGAP
ncbi:MAG TPA: hypothetical protein DHV21_07420 [Curvibacter sp.]|nr:hypothetical protein [Curvibacter sp.]